MVRLKHFLSLLPLIPQTIVKAHIGLEEEFSGEQSRAFVRNIEYKKKKKMLLLLIFKYKQFFPATLNSCTLGYSSS